jgi:uncharacterized protein YodC (DUF2158 family)
MAGVVEVKYAHPALAVAARVKSLAGCSWFQGQTANAEVSCTGWKTVPWLLE